LAAPTLTLNAPPRSSKLPWFDEYAHGHLFLLPYSRREPIFRSRRQSSLHAFHLALSNIHSVFLPIRRVRRDVLRARSCFSKAPAAPADPSAIVTAAARIHVRNDCARLVLICSLRSWEHADNALAFWPRRSCGASTTPGVRFSAASKPFQNPFPIHTHRDPPDDFSAPGGSAAREPAQFGVSECLSLLMACAFLGLVCRTRSGRRWYRYDSTLSR